MTSKEKTGSKKNQIIGIDIRCDEEIPKATAVYGHKDKKGIVIIDKIGRYNLVEEKEETKTIKEGKCLKY